MRLWFVCCFLLTYRKISPSVPALNMMEWVWLSINSIHQPSVLLNCPGWWIIHNMCYTFFVPVRLMSFPNGDWLRDNDAITWTRLWCVPIKVSNAAVVLVDLSTLLISSFSNRWMAAKVKNVTIHEADLVVQCGFGTCIRTANWNDRSCTLANIKMMLTMVLWSCHPYCSTLWNDFTIHGEHIVLLMPGLCFCFELTSAVSHSAKWSYHQCFCGNVGLESRTRFIQAPFCSL